MGRGDEEERRDVDLMGVGGAVRHRPELADNQHSGGHQPENGEMLLKEYSRNCAGDMNVPGTERRDP